MEPGRRLADDLDLVGGQAERLEQREGVGLGVEHRDRRRLSPTSGGRCR